MVRINVCGDVTLPNGRILFRCIELDFPSSRNTTIDSCVAEFQSIYPNGAINIKVDGRAFPFMDEPTQSYPIKLIRSPYSVTAYSEVEERLIKDFLGIEPSDLSPDEYLRNLSNEELSEWFNYWRNLKMQDPNFIPLLQNLYSKYSTAPDQSPQPKPITPDERARIELTVNLWNPLGITANSENLKSDLNFLLNPIGWECFYCITRTSLISLSFVKNGSPALPIFAIIAIIGIAVTGAVIIGLKWTTYKITEQETLQEIEKSKQITDTSDLLERVTQEHNEGKISDEEYAKILDYILNIEYKKPPDGGDNNIMDMATSLIPLVLVISVLSMLPKNK